MPEISALVEAGKATAGAPLGPALGPLGVNIGDIVAKINEKTKGYSGMKVPVTVVVDSSTKEFEIKVGSPPTSALIKKEINLQKGTGNPKTDFVGNITMAQIKNVAEMKVDNLTSTDIKAASKEIIGTCDSMGVKVEGKRAKEIMADVDAGAFDSVFGASGKVEKKEESIVEKVVDAVEDAVEAVEEAVGLKPHEEKAEEKEAAAEEKKGEAKEEKKEEIKEAPAEVPKEEKTEEASEEKKEEAK